MNQGFTSTITDRVTGQGKELQVIIIPLQAITHDPLTFSTSYEKRSPGKFRGFFICTLCEAFSLLFKMFTFGCRSFFDS
jgi:hypothetical protein